MLLSSVLFVLFLVGCWLYCLIDAALTPATEYPGLSKATWLGIIITTFIVGAIAWLIARWVRGSRWARRSWRSRSSRRRDDDLAWLTRWTAADEAIARHPAGRSRKPGAAPWTPPKGPDDDPEFLRLLDQRIRGASSD